jgi:hypothetical protein
MGATWSMVHDNGTMPSVGTNRMVPFSPTTPHKAEGTRIDARVSVPIDARPIPQATAMAEPPDDPPGMRRWSNGLALWGVVTTRANSWVDTLASTMAPAARARATATASTEGTTQKAAEPARVGTPAT